jgi:hypothetical protein
MVPSIFLISTKMLFYIEIHLILHNPPTTDLLTVSSQVDMSYRHVLIGRAHAFVVWRSANNTN